MRPLSLCIVVVGGSATNLVSKAAGPCRKLNWVHIIVLLSAGCASLQHLQLRMQYAAILASDQL